MSEEEGQDKKVAYEVAEKEFERFATAWRLDTDFDTMPDDDADDFRISKRKIVIQIVQGNAAVNQDGNIIYQLFEPVGTLEEVTLKRPRGKAWTNMDQSKVGKNVTKFNQIISAGINQLAGVVNKMDGIDIKFLHAVYTLFLGS